MITEKKHGEQFQRTIFFRALFKLRLLFVEDETNENCAIVQLVSEYTFHICLGT